MLMALRVFVMFCCGLFKDFIFSWTCGPYFKFQHLEDRQVDLCQFEDTQDYILRPCFKQNRAREMAQGL